MLQIVTLLKRIMFSQQKLGLSTCHIYHFCLEDGGGGVGCVVVGGGGCGVVGVVVVAVLTGSSCL